MLKRKDGLGHHRTIRRGWNAEEGTSFRSCAMKHSPSTWIIHCCAIFSHARSKIKPAVHRTISVSIKVYPWTNGHFNKIKDVLLISNCKRLKSWNSTTISSHTGSHGWNKHKLGTVNHFSVNKAAGKTRETSCFFQKLHESSFVFIQDNPFVFPQLAATNVIIYCTYAFKDKKSIEWLLKNSGLLAHKSS